MNNADQHDRNRNPDIFCVNRKLKFNTCRHHSFPDHETFVLPYLQIYLVVFDINNRGDNLDFFPPDNHFYRRFIFVFIEINFCPIKHQCTLDSKRIFCMIHKNPTKVADESKDIRGHQFRIQSRKASEARSNLCPISLHSIH